MPTAYISADQLKLAIVARKFEGSRCRWAVMSAHVLTGECRRGFEGYRLAARSLLTPMSRGELWRCTTRVASRGAKEFRKTFGIGVRAFKAENLYSLERHS